jgi:hypothetical protein
MQERWVSVGETAVHRGVKPDAPYKCISPRKMSCRVSGCQERCRAGASEIQRRENEGSRPKPHPPMVLPAGGMAPSNVK